MQLGIGDGRVQRAAFDRLGQHLGVNPQLGGEFQRLSDALDEDGHVGVDDQLHPAALAGLAQPQGLAPDRREHRARYRLRP